MACQNDSHEDPRGFLQAGDHRSSQGQVVDVDCLSQPPFTKRSRNRNSRTSTSSLTNFRSESSQINYKSPLSPVEILPRELDLDVHSKKLEPENKLVEKKKRAPGLVLTASHSDTCLIGLAATREAVGLSANSCATPRRASFIQRVMRKGKPTQETSVIESSRNFLSSSKALQQHILDRKFDPDADGLIHDVLRRTFKSEHKRQKLLLSLLTYSNANVEAPDINGMTALHVTADVCDLECARILLAFGANVNSMDGLSRTPLDLLGADSSEMESAVCVSASSNIAKLKLKPRVLRDKAPDMKKFLSTMGGLRGDFVLTQTKPPSVEPFPRIYIPSENERGHAKDFAEASDWANQLTSRYSELERSIQQRASRNTDFTPDEALSLSSQLHEMTLFQKAGSRILFLDGGGIRGLVQLEILYQLEQKTGRKVIELFDWIVGTSTGGIIALGLVYARKSVSELRQLYFKMKDEIFGKVKGGMSFNTVGLEALLKKEFTEHMCMDDVSYPRVLISAVQKEHINLKLHFFNNCFQDEFCKHRPVWKVARYTSAAPVLHVCMFGESDEYVDGGVLANNPSESGLSRIQDFYRKRGEKLPIALVVSIGCGKYPIKKLGSVDFLFVGSSGLNLASLKDGTSNFMSLLSYALVETSVTDENCRSRCEEQNIRYFRLNPRLTEVIESGETHVNSLLSMILQTREEMNKLTDFSHLVLCFHELSQKCKKMHAHILQ